MYNTYTRMIHTKKWLINDNDIHLHEMWNVMQNAQLDLCFHYLNDLHFVQGFSVTKKSQKTAAYKATPCFATTFTTMIGIFKSTDRVNEP